MDDDKYRKSKTEKVYVNRNSLLIDLKENNSHIKTIHHIFFVSLICFFISTAINDYVKNGYMTAGLHFILLTFDNVHIAVLYWMWAFIMTLIIYYWYLLWVKLRLKLLPKSTSIKLLDGTAFILLVTYYIFSLITAFKVVSRFHLPAASSAIIATEQVRMIMKVHAFIRTNAEKILKPGKASILPKLSNYLYFFFAPTLVYKDVYPRSNGIRYGFVMFRLLEVIAVICYQAILFHRFIMPVFKDFGLRTYSWLEITQGIFEAALPGLLIYVLGWYMVLHSVQNLCAEILRFGDRLFYKEWWTCADYSEYFRYWNILVHDWLFNYIYKDVYGSIWANKTFARFVVFITSAVVHEWCMSLILGFFFPLLFVHFFFFGAFFSMFLNVPNTAILNVLFWYSLAIGNGMLFALYSLEYYARVNVPVVNPTIRDYVLPRFISSGYIQ